MSRSEKKVPEQKGPINAAEMTSKQMTHAEKFQEASKWASDIKDGQTLKYHQPKQK